ncbi:MAG: ribonuclease III domain-containing protein [Flavobacteriaceae bacterium]|jgi:ribonuclease-3|nr:ribonuclease III domain-containing protein [Flavobacteriaceae bacterium]MDG1942108.1 ribonuclease III domain-containing protein [Flavobacteriaceae bacterium]
MFFSKLKKITTLKAYNKNVYRTAFTHRSKNLKDVDGHLINFERLEFLGDSILSIVVSSFLYDKFPFAKEGTLTKYRAKIVSRENLNQIGLKIDLVNFLDQKSKVNFGKNIHGNLLEALIGAVFVDRGYKKCSAFVMKKILGEHVDINQLQHTVLSYKGFLIEWGQKTKKSVKFKTNTDNGLDPEFNYTTQIFLDDKQIVKARGVSKKKSEEKAAKRAFHAMNIKSKIHG